MRWNKNYHYMPRYEWSSTTKHGDRYKRKAHKQIHIAELRAKTDDAVDLKRLILMGHTLNATVHYDFSTHEAYIEVMSAEAIKENVK